MKNTPNFRVRTSDQRDQANTYEKGFRAGQRAMVGRLLHVVQEALTITQARRDAKALLSEIKGGQ